MKPGTFAIRAAAAVPFLLLLHSLVRSSGLPYIVSGGVVAFFAAAALRPAACLQILTALVPFAAAMPWEWSRTVRWAEALTITFLAGSLLHFAVRRRRAVARTHQADLFAAGLAALVIASWVTGVVVLQYATDFPAHFLMAMWQLFTRDFFRDPGVFVRVNEALPVLEGVALFILTRRLAADHPALPHALMRMTVLGATASAGLNALRLVEILMRQGTSGFIAIVPSLRFSASHSDVNAAGSYFAMALPAALGLAAAGRGNAGWAAAAAVTGVALWFTGSRIAMASAAIGVLIFLTACVVLLRHRPTARVVAACALAAALVGLGGAAALYPSERGIAPSVALSIRADMARVAIALFRTRPVFGIGIGSFWERSGEYMPERLKASYARENAHNNFLQILAELGSAGLACFLGLLYFAVRPLRPVVQGPDATAVAGALSGLAAFLLSCLGGHPLLTREVLYPFWILIGALSVLREVPEPSMTALSAPLHSRRWWLAAATVALALSIPFRAQRELREGDFENRAIGYSIWSTADDGVRFRWAEPRSRLFVPASSTSVLLPLRLGAQTAGAVIVTVRLDGQLANRVTVSRERWTMVRLVMPALRHPPRYRTIELEIEPAPGAFQERPSESAGPHALMVGRVGLS